MIQRNSDWFSKLRSCSWEIFANPSKTIRGCPHLHVALWFTRHCSLGAHFTPSHRVTVQLLQKRNSTERLIDYMTTRSPPVGKFGARDPNQSLAEFVLILRWSRTLQGNLWGSITDSFRWKRIRNVISLLYRAHTLPTLP